MGKREILLNTKKNIDENGFTTCQYFNPDTNCYCAVGYVLKELGMTDDELVGLSSQAIDSIVYGHSSVNSELTNRVAWLVNNSEFTIEELAHLQSVNDQYHYRENATDPTYVLSHIDTMIESEPDKIS